MAINGASVYARLALGNGSVVHLVGERHGDSLTCFHCKKPNCFRTYNALVAELLRQARSTDQQLDVFVERRASMLWHPDRNETLSRLLKGYKKIVPLFAEERGGATQDRHVRMHLGDLRDFELHPFTVARFLNELKNANVRNKVEKQRRPTRAEVLAMLNAPHPYQPPYFVDVDRLDLVRATLYSNAYNKNGPKFENHVKTGGRFFDNHMRGASHRSPLVKTRNATTFEGASVSRLRKQIMKLGHGLDKAMFALFDKLYRRNYSFSYLLLTDMYAVSRMLYYAGYGKTLPDKPSKVVIWFGGSEHTFNMVHMLHALDKLSGGVLGVRVESERQTKGGCLRIPMAEWRTGFEFTK
jgi:hypothetical protein